MLQGRAIETIGDGMGQKRLARQLARQFHAEATLLQDNPGLTEQMLLGAYTGT